MDSEPQPVPEQRLFRGNLGRGDFEVERFDQKSRDLLLRGGSGDAAMIFRSGSGSTDPRPIGVPQAPSSVHLNAFAPFWHVSSILVQPWTRRYIDA